MNNHYLILALLSAVELSQTRHSSVQFSWAELSAVEQNGHVEKSGVWKLHRSIWFAKIDGFALKEDKLTGVGQAKLPPTKNYYLI